jgi:RimJ/RimL family protein N-acetyltransferase
MLVHSLTPQAALGLIAGGGITLTTERQRDVAVRRGGAEDAELLWEMHCRLSERTIRLRYGAPKHLYPAPALRDQMQRMLGAEASMAATLIGTVEDGASHAAVSLVQLVHDPADPSTAEIAIVVRDDYQREGLGRALSRLVRYVAQARGVRRLCINALAENRAIMRLVRGSGVPYIAETLRGETTIFMPLDGDS